MDHPTPEQLPDALAALLNVNSRVVRLERGGELISVELGDIRMEFEHMGEGFNGDYDQDDPDDVPLLRFAFMARSQEDAMPGSLDIDDASAGDGAWEEISGSSYCTYVDARAPGEVRVAYALKIFSRIQLHLEAEMGDELLGDAQNAWQGISSRMVEELSLTGRDDGADIMAVIDNYRLDQNTLPAIQSARSSPRL